MQIHEKIEDSSRLTSKDCQIMAEAMEKYEGQKGASSASWETCPTELLLMIFEMVPTKTLSSCLFVNSRWKTLVEYLVERDNKWEEMVNAVIINNGDTFKIKSEATFSFRQIYYNYVLWNNLHKANISLHKMQKVDNIKMINVYRDNLIVVTHKNVQYYKVNGFLFRTVEIACTDFTESDYMIIVAQDDFEGYITLQLYKKTHIDDFNIDNTNVRNVEKVIFYKMELNRCYVMNHLNCLFVYAMLYPVWRQIFIARFYGPCYEWSVRAMNVFDSRVYLMACGSIFVVDAKTRNFQKILQFKVLDRSQTTSCKMFHRFGFMYGVNAKEKPQIERYTLFKNNVFVYKLPNLSCMTQHGDILLLGYLDGKVEFVSPRDLSTTKPLCSFNLKDFNKSINDVEVISIDVHEGHGVQHVFIATRTEIYHLHITHTNCEDYMWSKYTDFASLHVDEAVDGLAFKNRNEMLDLSDIY